MNSSNVIHQTKLDIWADLIREQQASTLTVSEWCESKQISRDQYYYWKRKIKDRFVESQLPDIVPLSVPVSQQCFTSCTTDVPTLPRPSSIKIYINDFSIEVGYDTSERLLTKVIKAVRHA